ncbi:hypothetical protein MMC29_004916 [Sticta canariensis]|nr:hypothetical protein [Sticta canariensis]
MTEPRRSSMETAMEELISTYHELNGSHVDELAELPTPLEFMQYVRRGRPLVIRGAVSEWPAMQWTAEYLETEMTGSRVQIAVTPSGNADAVVLNHDENQTYFVKPLERDEYFTDFIHDIRAQEFSDLRETNNVKYSQAQNDNLRGEYVNLYKDVDKDISWAKIAFGGQEPDAINLWIGNSRSVTALHKDNYENIYCQIIGSKHFVLLSPLETACVNERMLPCATYALNASSRVYRRKQGWQLSIEQETVPFATWNPDNPIEQQTRFTHLSRPLRVDLNPGDLLYLPTLW